MSEHLLRGLERFRDETFPRYRELYHELVAEGQRPSTLFIGCSDSRVVPHLLTDSRPGDLFVARNVGAFVPPFDPEAGHHETAAAVEYAVGILEVGHIVVCGHSQCGAVRALYEPPEAATPNLTRWLQLGREARLDIAGGSGPPGEDAPDEETLRRTERRSVARQLERLAEYPMVKERTEEGALALHGWHYVLEEGRVDVLDVDRGVFTATSGAEPEA
jgi:carbonic anhydrase